MLLFSAIFFLSAIILQPGCAAAGALKGLILWYKHIVPSLLAPMLLTSYIISDRKINDFFRKTSSRSSKLSPGLSMILICGLLCGSPMGAKTCSDFYSQGLISKRDFEKLIILIQIPSPAFISGYVCSEILKVKTFIPFIICAYIPMLLYLIVFFVLPCQENETVRNSTPEGLPVSEYSFNSLINSAIMTIVRIGVIIMLFSTGSNLFLKFAPKCILSDIFCGCLEITTGINLIASANIPQLYKEILCLFFIEFGGLSIHLQVIDASGKNSFSFFPYLIYRFAAGIISASAYFIFL